MPRWEYLSVDEKRAWRSMGVLKEEYNGCRRKLTFANAYQARKFDRGKVPYRCLYCGHTHLATRKA